MPSAMQNSCLWVLTLLLVACSKPPATPPTDAGAVDAVAARDGSSPAEAPSPVQAPSPQDVDFASDAPVPFGADEQALRLAWGGELRADPIETADACHYLYPQPRPAQGYGTAFMFEGGRFVRMDVDDAARIAPGGGRIGMAAAEIAALYPGRVEEQLHKYVEGARYLRVADAAGVVLLFETDAQGVVRTWRAGLPPQVDYVEGCG